MTAGPSELQSFILGMTDAIYTEHRTKVQDILMDIWDLPDTPEQRAWADSGWTHWQKISDPSKIIRTYIVSLKQIKAVIDDAEIAKLKAIVANNPGVKMLKSWDITGSMQELGYEPIPSPDIP